MNQIRVYGISRGSPEFTLDLCETEEQLRLLTVRDLKEKISSKTGIDKDRLWLYRREMLRDDNRSLSEYGITHETTICYVENYKRGIQLIIIELTGKWLCIHLDSLNEPVENAKAHIQDDEGLPIDQQRLIFEGKQLEDGRSLSECGVQHMDMVHLVPRLRGGWEPAENSGNMGDRDGKNASMDFLADFDKPSGCIIN